MDIMKNMSSVMNNFYFYDFLIGPLVHVICLYGNFKAAENNLIIINIEKKNVNVNGLKDG